MNVQPSRASAIRSIAYFAGGLTFATIGTIIVQQDSVPSANEAHSIATSALHEFTKADHAALKPVAEDGREMVTRLSDALAETNREARNESLHHLAESLAEHDVATALAMGARIPDENDKVEFLRTVFAKWAMREPAQALAQALGYPAGLVRSETVTGAIASWSSRQPRAALAWLDANVTGPLKEESLVTVAMNWAAKDPEAAGAWFISSGSNSPAVISGLVTTWADHNPRTAAQWIEGLRDPENKQNARLALASEWAGQSPDKAAEYVSHLLGERGGSELAGSLVNTWGAADPRATAKWVATLPSGPLKNESATMLATVWAESDISSAALWAAQFPDPETKATVTGQIATAWGGVEPEKALAWLASLPPDPARTTATRGALASWAATDVPGLEKWVAKQPVNPTTDQALASLANVQVHRSPAVALQTAQAINDATERMGSLVKIYHNWNKQDPAAAADWLKTSAPPEVQQSLIQRLIFNRKN